MRGKPFPNDHLDQFFNAAVDAGILLASFIRAADAVGLGTCPISVIRDHSARVSEMLGLPQRVIPVAGMCVGWPSEAGTSVHGCRCRARCMTENTTRAISRRASKPMIDAAPRSIRTSRAIRRAGARCRSTAVRGQGAAIRRAAAGGFRRVRAEEGIQSRLSFGRAAGLPLPLAGRGSALCASQCNSSTSLHVLLHAPVQRIGDENLAARTDRDVMRLAVLAERLAVPAPPSSRARCR